MFKRSVLCKLVPVFALRDILDHNMKSMQEPFLLVPDLRGQAGAESSPSATAADVLEAPAAASDAQPPPATAPALGVHLADALHRPLLRALHQGFNFTSFLQSWLFFKPHLLEPGLFLSRMFLNSCSEVFVHRSQCPF